MIAIRPVADFNTWTPQTENILDLRLFSEYDVEKENALIAKKSAEMGAKLTEVYTYLSFISSEGLEALHRNSPNIRKLNLWGANKVGDVALKVISQFADLEELNLGYARNPRPDLPGNIPDLSGNITDAGVAEVLDKCPKLSKIDLAVPGVTDKILERIAGLPKITAIRINNWFGQHDDQIATLAKARPDLTIICNDGTKLGDDIVANKALANGVKDRYYLREPAEGGGFYAKLKPEVAASERELISPSVFVG